MPGDTYPNGFKDEHRRPIGAGIFQTAARKIAGQGGHSPEDRTEKDAFKRMDFLT